jgi:hypothetical protein
MLRITVHDEAAALTLQFEGKLAGPWVQEAAACWQRTLASRRGSDIRLDLRGVTMIDPTGKELLTAAHAQGAKLVACGCLMRALVAELTHTQISGECP